MLDSDQKGFLKAEKDLLSRIEVGLITASVLSEKAFRLKPVNKLGKDGGFFCSLLSFGDGKTVSQSAIIKI